MKQPTDKNTIIHDKSEIPTVDNDLREDFVDGEHNKIDENIEDIDPHSWGQYLKPYGWISRDVWTGKAVREFILQELVASIVIQPKPDIEALHKTWVPKEQLVILKNSKGEEIGSFVTTVLEAVNVYTIIFDTKGGNSIGNLTLGLGETLDLSQFTPTKPNYTFKGWYETSDYSEGPITSWTATGEYFEKTFYAKWEEAAQSEYIN